MSCIENNNLLAIPLYSCLNEDATTLPQLHSVYPQMQSFQNLESYYKMSTLRVASVSANFQRVTVYKTEIT